MGKLSDYFADNVFGIIHNSHTDQDQQKAQETLQTKISLKCKTSDIFVHMFYILYKILLYSPLFDSSMKKVIPYSSVSLKIAFTSSQLIGSAPITRQSLKFVTCSRSRLVNFNISSIRPEKRSG